MAFSFFFFFFFFFFMAFNIVWRIHRNWAKKLIFRLIRFRPFYVLWLRPQLFPKLKILWKYITVTNFISITFAVANLKILKILHSDSVSMKWPFLVRVGGVWGVGGIWNLIPPPNMVTFCWFFHHRYYSIRQKRIWKIFWELKFLRKQDVPKVYTFDPSLTNRFPLDMAEIEQSKCFNRSRKKVHECRI